MKWESHRECTKAIAEDLNLPIEPMLNGCVYPDQVAMNKSVTIEGIEMCHPHHKETDRRIRDMLLQLRSKKLKDENVDAFSLGCLCHLIQDGVVVPSAHPKFVEMTRDIAKYKIKDEWRRENIPVMDVAIIDEIPNILTKVNPDNPEEALKEGYQNSLLVLKSILQDPYLPAKYQPIYEECKKELEACKKTRYAYLLCTYLNPLFPIIFFINAPPYEEINIVKRYGYYKRGDRIFLNGLLSLLAFLISGFAWWGFWCLLPLLGLLLTTWLKIPKELMRNSEWFNFEK